jgi:hypothetical protein
LFDLWQNQDYLRGFFEEHQVDFHSYYKGISIEDAIRITRKEAEKLQRKLLDYAKDPQFSLSSLFQKLNNNEYKLQSHEKSKVKLRWLRIYAIRVDENFFVISGGAIKVVESMQDKAYLIEELRKLEITKRYLLDKEDDDLEFFELL